MLYLSLQVAGRDQAILKLQTELDTTAEKYQGAIEEVGGYRNQLLLLGAI